MIDFKSTRVQVVKSDEAIDMIEDDLKQSQNQSFPFPPDCKPVIPKLRLNKRLNSEIFNNFSYLSTTNNVGIR